MTAHVVERLSAFLDDELPEAERREVQGHLEACPSCAAHLSELAAVDQAARGLAVQAPDGYFETLPGRIRQRLRTKRRPALPVWGWAAAAALLVAVVTPLLKRDPFAPQKAPAATPATLASPPATLALPEAPAPPVQAAEVPKPRASEPARKESPTPSPGRIEPEARAGSLESHELKDVARDAEKGEQPVPQEAAGFAAPPQPAPTFATPAPSAIEEKRLTAPAEADQPAAAAAGSGLTAGGSLAKARRKQDEEQGRADETKSSSARPGAQPPRSAQEARTLREDWRRRADRQPEGPEGDEARFRTIEAGELAWRLGHDPGDLAILRQDADTYLARGDARRAERVRALLRSLDEER